MNRFALLAVAALLPALGGCDQLKERMGIANPVKQEAEGKAIGAGCRNAGQGLEDCYRQNPDTAKADIYAGWKDMNEYMSKNNMPVIPPNSTMPAGPAPATTPAPTTAPDAAAAPAKPAKEGAAH